MSTEILHFNCTENKTDETLNSPVDQIAGRPGPLFFVDLQRLREFS